jgi:hypothetical protein
MFIPDFYVPVAFAGRKADEDGTVSFDATTVTFRDIEVVGVNVKAIAPFDDAMHVAKISVMSSKVESSNLLRIGVSLDDLAPFHGDNVREIGVAEIEYDDPSDCVRPIDVGCANPRLPVGLMDEDHEQAQSVTGDLFRVEMTISDYEPGTFVNAVVALCYEPGFRLDENAGIEA